MYQVITSFIGAMRGGAWLMSAGRVHVTRVMSISLEEIYNSAKLEKIFKKHSLYSRNLCQKNSIF